MIDFGVSVENQFKVSCCDIANTVKTIAKPDLQVLKSVRQYKNNRISTLCSVLLFQLS